MIPLLLLGLGASQASDPTLLAGPDRHTPMNHLRLWAEIDNTARPLSIGHEIVLSERRLSEILEDKQRDWVPADAGGKEPRRFYLDGTRDWVEVAPDGSWRSSDGDRGHRTRFATSGKHEALVLDDEGVLWTYAERVSGITYDYELQWKTEFARLEVSGLLGNLDDWRFVYYQDDVGSLSMAKLLALPRADGGSDVDRSRDGYAFVALPDGDGDMHYFASRLVFDDHEPRWARHRAGGTAFVSYPVVAVGKWRRWTASMAAFGQARFGPTEDLDRPWPDATAGARALVHGHRMTVGAELGSTGGSALLGRSVGRVGYLGVRGGALLEEGFFTVALGAAGRVARGSWQLDAELGLGSAWTMELALSKVVRTRSPWDLIVGPRVQTLDMDWTVDEKVRFPVYGGVQIGLSRSRLRLTAE